MEILKMDNVGLVYHTETAETEAIKNISLTINDGEFVAVIGPSGCGKTSVLSLISGLIKPSRGNIYLEGNLVVKPDCNEGYMLQRDHLFEWRTIQNNIFLGLEIQKAKNIKPKSKNDKRPLKTRKAEAEIIYNENKEYALGLLDKYGLKDFVSFLPKQLSGGMRQRAALIRTLAFKPKILLLDEPFSALDYQTRIAVCDDVQQIIKAEKKTAVLVTHDISEAISLADRIVILSERPAIIKNIYTVDIEGNPLQRRESPKFAGWFDKVWKEVCV